MHKECLSDASIESYSEGEGEEAPVAEVEAEGGMEEKSVEIEDEIDCLAELEEKYGSTKMRLTDFYLEKAWFEQHRDYDYF